MNYEELWNKNPNVVRVWNDNQYPHGPEDFKGDRIHIPAGKNICMDVNEAREFLAQYWPMEMDADGNQKPQSYKQLRIEMPSIPQPEKSPEYRIICNKCGFTARSKDELDGHVLNNHLDDLADDETKKDMIAKGKKGAAS